MRHARPGTGLTSDRRDSGGVRRCSTAGLRDPEMRALLREVDVLIDGPFVLSERTLSMRFRGSKNQRVIDVPASLQSGAVVEKNI